MLGIGGVMVLFFAGLFWISQDLREAAEIRSRTPVTPPTVQYTRAVRSTGESKNKREK